MPPGPVFFELGRATWTPSEYCPEYLIRGEQLGYLVTPEAIPGEDVSDPTIILPGSWAREAAIVRSVATRPTRHEAWLLGNLHHELYGEGYRHLDRRALRQFGRDARRELRAESRETISARVTAALERARAYANEDRLRHPDFADSGSSIVDVSSDGDESIPPLEFDEPAPALPLRALESGPARDLPIANPDLPKPVPARDDAAQSDAPPGAPESLQSSRLDCSLSTLPVEYEGPFLAPTVDNPRWRPAGPLEGADLERWNARMEDVRRMDELRDLDENELGDLAFRDLVDAAVGVVVGAHENPEIAIIARDSDASSGALAFDDNGEPFDPTDPPLGFEALGYQAYCRGPSPARSDALDALDVPPAALADVGAPGPSAAVPDADASESDANSSFDGRPPRSIGSVTLYCLGYESFEAYYRDHPEARRSGASTPDSIVLAARRIERERARAQSPDGMIFVEGAPPPFAPRATPAASEDEDEFPRLNFFWAEE